MAFAFFPFIIICINIKYASATISLNLEFFYCLLFIHIFWGFIEKHDIMSVDL